MPVKVAYEKSGNLYIKFVHYEKRSVVLCGKILKADFFLYCGCCQQSNLNTVFDYKVCICVPLSKTRETDQGVIA